MSDKPFAHLTVKSDKVAVQRGGVYHGGIMTGSAGTGSVIVYDGLNATTGTLIDYFIASDGNRDRHVFERGVDLREGLYVHIGDKVGAFTVFYEPPTGREA